jgi:predicted nucleotidyltransferase
MTAKTLLTRQTLKEKREAILEIARRYGAHDVRIFGSVARGDATEQSDLDLIVRFDEGRTLLDQGGLLMELREFLGMKVDVVSEGALTGRFGQIARKEAVPL